MNYIYQIKILMYLQAALYFLSFDVFIGFFQSLKSILTNPLYILTLFLTLLQASSHIGSVTYVFKYVEQQYGKSASETSILLGETHCLCLLYKRQTPKERSSEWYFVVKAISCFIKHSLLFFKFYQIHPSCDITIALALKLYLMFFFMISFLYLLTVLGHCCKDFL